MFSTPILTNLPCTQRLLTWYRQNRILYPWRKTRDPYRVWLSEILLQQTRIPVVLRYYDRILKLFPTIQDLARAKDSVFLSAWSGIGYYSRARNMLGCARQIVERHGGKFPRDFSSLVALPGIGPYTAGALRNLCFDELTPAMDGNISRVLARIANDSQPMGSKTFRDVIQRTFLQLGAGASPGDFFQSLMELGERICLPAPACGHCPVRSDCLAFKNGTTSQIPNRPQKKKEQTHYWYLLLLQKGTAYRFVQNRKREFLKDSWIFPDVLSRQKLSQPQLRTAFRQSFGLELDNARPVLTLRHSVTFRRIHVQVLKMKAGRVRDIPGKWLREKDLAAHPTSSITHKVLQKLRATTRVAAPTTLHS